MFQQDVLFGFLGIFCGLFAFVYGWLRARDYFIVGVMIVWSGTLLFGLLLQGAVTVAAALAAAVA